MIDTISAEEARWRRVPPWVVRLGRSGAPEAIFGFLTYLYNETFLEPGRVRAPLDAFVEFFICFFAAVTGRWPRVGTLGVAVCLLWMNLTWQQGDVTTSVFALFIPVVSNGAHGRTLLRDIGAAVYFVLAVFKTLPIGNAPSEVVATVVVWAVLVLLAWAAGRTVNRLREEGERQVELRAEALRSQRRSIARDLHDTVSYSTTTMIMRAEQIKLRTLDNPELVADLDFIIGTGRRSVRDLRSMMETLRRNDPDLDLEENPAWRLITVGDVIADRQAELAAHGFRLDVSTDADLDSLPSSVRETLGKLIVEATSNMVKHAGRGPCRLIIEVHDNTLEAVFTSPLRRGRDLARTTAGLGIVGALERVEALGGELEATAASGTWILRAQLPVGG